jgi:hypothetical protein
LDRTEQALLLFRVVNVRVNQQAVHLCGIHKTARQIYQSSGSWRFLRVNKLGERCEPVPEYRAPRTRRGYN